MSKTGEIATVQLKTLGQIAITVRDLAVSTAFYRDTLGMKFLFDAGSMTFFQCDSVRLLLGTAEGDSSDTPLAPSSTILYFMVDDLIQTHASLLTRGVSFSREPHLVAKMSDHDLWMAFLKDPEGNTIGLMNEVRRSETKVS
jgi:methylmalonyl-CoA/ethylmalonyl-CoA epimerase